MILTNPHAAWASEMMLLFPDPDFEEMYAFSPLHKAILSLGSYQYPSTIWKYVDILDNDERTPLSWAAQRGDDEAVHELLIHGANCNRLYQDGTSPLMYAVQKAIRCTELLLAAGADVDIIIPTSGYTALHCATFNLDAEASVIPRLKALVEIGGNVNPVDTFDMTPLDYVMHRGSTETASYLIACGARTGNKYVSGNNILYLAARKNSHPMIKLVLGLGLDHTRRIAPEGTFMHVVAQFADTRTVQLLSQASLQLRDINSKDKKGFTPVQLAIQRRDVNSGWRDAFFGFLKSVDEQFPTDDSKGMFQDKRMSHPATKPQGTGDDGDLRPGISSQPEKSISSEDPDIGGDRTDSKDKARTASQADAMIQHGLDVTLHRVDPPTYDEAVKRSPADHRKGICFNLLPETYESMPELHTLRSIGSQVWQEFKSLNLQLYEASKRMETKIDRVLKSNTEDHQMVFKPSRTLDNCRVRWRCNCGFESHDDFVELVPGAAKEWEAFLRQYFNGSRSQQGGGFGAYIRRCVASILQLRQYRYDGNDRNEPAQGLSGHGPSLPLHTSDNLDHTRSNTLFILLAFPYYRWGLRLTQPKLQNINSDRQFFELINATHLQTKSWLKRLLSLKTIKSIKFTALEMHQSGVVGITAHDPWPECNDANYDFDPKPPHLNPPCGENFLKHMIRHPHHANSDTQPFVTRIPKRRSKLATGSSGVGLGWGLHFDECWDVCLLGIAACGLSLTGLLVFFVCWAAVTRDAATAASIAAMFGGMLAVLIASVQAFVALGAL